MPPLYFPVFVTVTLSYADYYFLEALQRYKNDLLALEYIQQTGGFANRGFSYKINWWDNTTAIRQTIQADLNRQIDEIEKNKA